MLRKSRKAGRVKIAQYGFGAEKVFGAGWPKCAEPVLGGVAMKSRVPSGTADTGASAIA